MCAIVVFFIDSKINYILVLIIVDLTVFYRTFVSAKARDDTRARMETYVCDHADCDVFFRFFLVQRQYLLLSLNRVLFCIDK